LAPEHRAPFSQPLAQIVLDTTWVEASDCGSTFESGEVMHNLEAVLLPLAQRHRQDGDISFLISPFVGEDPIEIT
jgi:hypothetical protein